MAPKQLGLWMVKGKGKGVVLLERKMYNFDKKNQFQCGCSIQSAIVYIYMFYIANILQIIFSNVGRSMLNCVNHYE